MAKWKPIVEELTRAIRDGQYRPGDRLPSAAEIERRYDVGNRTARETHKELVRRGLAVKHPSRGTYVGHDAGHLLLGSREPSEAGPRVVLAARDLAPADGTALSELSRTLQHARPPTDVALLLDIDARALTAITRVVLGTGAGALTVRTAYRPGPEGGDGAAAVATSISVRDADAAEARDLGAVGGPVLQHDAIHTRIGRAVLLVRSVALAENVRLADHYDAPVRSALAAAEVRGEDPQYA